jgi:hypothetical protein
LAKTNREQSLIVHALFGKRNLRHLAVEDKNPTPDCYPSSKQMARETAESDAHRGLNLAFLLAIRADGRPSVAARLGL